MKEQIDLFDQDTSTHKKVIINSSVHDLSIKEKDGLSFPEVEHISCQHCQDVGICTFCKRGRKELSKTHYNKMN